MRRYGYKRRFKRRYKRRTKRSRRSFKKRFRRRGNRNVHKYVRSIKTVYEFGNNSATQVKEYSLNFKLSDVPNVSEFTTLYDQYMITGVKVKLVPRASSSDANTGEKLGNMISVIDYDDSTNLASIDEYMQRVNKRITRDNVTHIRFLRPCVASMVYQSAFATAYGPKRMRLDMTNSQVPHFGLKLYWDNGAWPVTDGTKKFDVYLTYYFTCYNVR